MEQLLRVTALCVSAAIVLCSCTEGDDSSSGNHRPSANFTSLLQSIDEACLQENAAQAQGAIAKASALPAKELENALLSAKGLSCQHQLILAGVLARRPDMEPILRKHIGHSDERIRMCSSYALVEMVLSARGVVDEPVVTSLESLLHARQGDVRATAAWFLASLNHRSERIAAELVAALKRAAGMKERDQFMHWLSEQCIGGLRDLTDIDYAQGSENMSDVARRYEAWLADNKEKLRPVRETTDRESRHIIDDLHGYALSVPIAFEGDVENFRREGGARCFLFDGQGRFVKVSTAPAKGSVEDELAEVAGRHRISILKRTTTEGVAVVVYRVDHAWGRFFEMICVKGGRAYGVRAFTPYPNDKESDLVNLLKGFRLR